MQFLNNISHLSTGETGWNVGPKIWFWRSKMKSSAAEKALWPRSLEKKSWTLPDNPKLLNLQWVSRMANEELTLAWFETNAASESSAYPITTNNPTAELSVTTHYNHLTQIMTLTGKPTLQTPWTMMLYHQLPRKKIYIHVRKAPYFPSTMIIQFNSFNFIYIAPMYNVQILFSYSMLALHESDFSIWNVTMCLTHFLNQG